MIPTSCLADYITNLACQHGVSYEMTPGDAMADVLTSLADDEIRMDRVVLLLLALERAGVIPTEEVVPLHLNYLREKLNVVGGTDHAGSNTAGQP